MNFVLNTAINKLDLDLVSTRSTKDLWNAIQRYFQTAFHTDGFWTEGRELVFRYFDAEVLLNDDEDVNVIAVSRIENGKRYYWELTSTPNSGGWYTAHTMNFFASCGNGMDSYVANVLSTLRDHLWENGFTREKKEVK